MTHEEIQPNGVRYISCNPIQPQGWVDRHLVVHVLWSWSFTARRVVRSAIAAGRHA